MEEAPVGPVADQTREIGMFLGRLAPPFDDERDGRDREPSKFEFQGVGRAGTVACRPTNRAGTNGGRA